MAQFITALIDIALGALAYRLAYENRRATEAVKADVSLIMAALKKAGIL